MSRRRRRSELYLTSVDGTNRVEITLRYHRFIPGVLFAVLKLLKMAKSVRALLDTVMQALPEVGNLGLLFFWPLPLTTSGPPKA